MAALGRSEGDGPVASVIEERQLQLASSVSELARALDDLQSKLVPVMCQQGTGEACGKAQQESTNSSVAMFLSSTNAQVRGLIAQVHSINDRLET